MALIDCGECGAQISDKSAACVKCGAPVAQKMEPMGKSTSGLPKYEGSYEPPSSPTKFNQGGPQIYKTAKSRGTYIILGLFFGLLGIHNFYAGRLMVDAAQLLITCILGWVVIGLVITAIWAIADLFMVDTDGAGDKFA